MYTQQQLRQDNSDPYSQYHQQHHHQDPQSHGNQPLVPTTKFEEEEYHPQHQVPYVYDQQTQHNDGEEVVVDMNYNNNSNRNRVVRQNHFYESETKEIGVPTKAAKRFGTGKKKRESSPCCCRSSGNVIFCATFLTCLGALLWGGTLLLVSLRSADSNVLRYPLDITKLGKVTEKKGEPKFKDDLFEFHMPGTKKGPSEEKGTLEGDLISRNERKIGTDPLDLFGNGNNKRSSFGESKDPKEEADHTLKSQKNEMSKTAWKSNQEAVFHKKKATMYDKMLKSIMDNLIRQMAVPVNDYLVQIVVNLDPLEFNDTGSMSVPLKKTLDLRKCIKDHVSSALYSTKISRSFDSEGNLYNQEYGEEFVDRRLEDTKGDVYADGLLQLLISPEVDLKCCCKDNKGRKDCKKVDLTLHSNLDQERRPQNSKGAPIDPRALLKHVQIRNPDCNDESLIKEECYEEDLILGLGFYPKNVTSNKQRPRDSKSYRLTDSKAFTIKVECSLVLLFDKMTAYETPT